MTKAEITAHNLTVMSIRRQNGYRKMKGMPLLEVPEMIELTKPPKKAKAVPVLTYEQERNKLIRLAEKTADAACGEPPAGDDEMYNAYGQTWNCVFHAEMERLWAERVGREG